MFTRFSLFIAILFSALSLGAQDLPVKLQYHEITAHTFPETSWKRVDSLIDNGLPRKALTELLATAEKAYTEKNLKVFTQSMQRIENAVRSARFEEDTLQAFLYDFAQKAFAEQAPYRNFRFATLESWLGAYHFTKAIRGGNESLDWPELGKLQVGNADVLRENFAAHTLDEPEVLMQYATKDMEGSEHGEVSFYTTFYNAAQPVSLFEYFVMKRWRNVSYSYYQPDHKATPALFGETDELVNTELASHDDSLTFRYFYHLEKLNLFTKRYEEYAGYVVTRLGLASEYNKSMPEETRDSLFLAACYHFREKLAGKPSSAVFTDAIARTLARQAANWHYQNNPKHEDGFNRALQEIDASLDAFPKSQTAHLLKALRQEILENNIRLSFKVEPVLDQPSLVNIRYRNTGEAWLSVFKVNRYGKGNYPNQLRGTRITKIASEKLAFEQGMKHLYHDKDLIIPAIHESGDYFFVISDTPDNAANLFTIDTLSKLKNVSYQVAHVGFLQLAVQRGEKTTILVNDRRSGEPVNGARVFSMRMYDNHPRRQLVGQTNAKGMVVLDRTSSDYQRYEFSAQYKDDSVSQNYYEYGNYDEAYENRYRLFTDRAIYRPGQQVFFKILAVKEAGDYFKILTSNKVTVEFTDENGTELYSQKLQTNDFGSASSSFSLPVSGFLPGMIYISVGDRNIGSFRVEEYKRPTFEITFDPVKEAYRFGDSVTVRGSVTALAGYPISDAKVTVTVNRSYFFYRWFEGSHAESETQYYEVATDAEGRFELRFLAEKGKGYYGMQYQLTATASDATGETHDESIYVSVGEQALDVLITNQRQHYRSDANNELQVRVQNSEGQLQKDKTVFYTLNRIQTEGRKLLSKAEYQAFSEAEFEKQFPEFTFTDHTQRTEQATGNLLSGDSINLNQITAGKDGRYELRAFVVGESGDTSATSILFNYLNVRERKHSGISGLMLSFPEDTDFKPGKKMHFTLGAEGDAAPVLLSYYNTEGLISSQWLTVKGSTEITYTPAPQDKNGLVIEAVAYIHGEFLSESRRFSYTDPNRHLAIKLETQRDYLRPGASEKWILTVRDTSGLINDAELLAALYDASLDQFSGHSWNADFSRYFSVLSGWERNYNSFLMSSNNFWPESSELANSGGIMTVRGARTYAFYDLSTEAEAGKALSVTMGMISTSTADVQMNAVPSAGYKDLREEKKLEQTERKSVEPEVQIRENFNETAFFYPNVYALPDSTYQLEFTLPDALTRWKLMTFAHTKSLQYGSEQLTFEARKELMVQANAPRFFRENDRFIFQAKVINTSDRKQEVRVRLTFSDPFTGKDLTEQFGRTAEQVISVDSSASKEVRWELQIPQSVSVVAYELKAIGSEFADGERKTIPVLSNRMLIRTAKPFVKTGTGTSEFDFKALSELSPGAEKLNLTIRLQTQTVWSALMSLPYLMEYPYECSEQVFARYFSNALAVKIINDNPEFRRVVDSWKQDDPSAFVSALEQNEELKNIILLETPWVLDAHNESSEKARLEVLFNQNQLQREIGLALDKLINQKANDGGWGWWKSRESNPYITQHIVSGLGRMKKLGIDFDESIVNSAFDYLDKHYLEAYRQLSEKDKKQKHGLSEMIVHYLVSRSYFDLKDNEAIRYYQSLLGEQWTEFSLQAQALAGMAAHDAGNNELAQKIRASLLDKSTFRSEQGRYWVNNTYGYYWNQAPVETHSTIMEFFSDMGSSEKELREMQLWLILQKRTTSWETTKASTLACNALLLVKADRTSDREVKVSLANGTKLPVNVQSPENSFSYGKGEINESLAHIRVESNSEEPVTGAFHLAYLEDLDQIKSSEGVFRVERHYYIVGKDGERLLKDGEQITAGTRLRVKIQLTSGQDLEYVHVKDSKAAGFEAVETLSGYKYGKLYYFQTSKDASTDFFIDYLPKGSYYFEYELFVTGSGELHVGPATAECMYAPEFRANTGGLKIRVH